MPSKGSGRAAGTPEGRLQLVGGVAKSSVRARVSSLTADQKRRICWLFDHCGGDADYTAERCGIVKVQRGDVLAVVLADTRKGRLAA